MALGGISGFCIALLIAYVVDARARSKFRAA
jgi:hypothetical protein